MPQTPITKEELLGVDHGSPEGDKTVKLYGTVKDGVVTVTREEVVEHNPLKSLLQQQEEGLEDEKCSGSWCDHEILEPHYVLRKDRIRNDKLALLQALKDEVEKMKLTKKNQGYEGNDLGSACDFYGIAADSWSEIIRYEDGHNSALSDFSFLLSSALNQKE